MPSSMIHLSVAKKYNPNSEITFYIGNLAPDSISDMNIKHEIHLRDVPNRETALKDFILNSKYLKNSFFEGIVLHLFADWKWDIQFMLPFSQRSGDGWFPKYRNEIGLASAYLYHHTNWSIELWKKMDSFDISNFSNIGYLGTVK